MVAVRDVRKVMTLIDITGVTVITMIIIESSSSVAVIQGSSRRQAVQPPLVSTASTIIFTVFIPVIGVSCRTTMLLMMVMTRGDSNIHDDSDCPSAL
jgi:hypothetical protein